MTIRTYSAALILALWCSGWVNTLGAAPATGALAILVRAYRESPTPARRSAIATYLAGHPKDAALANLALGVAAYEQKNYAAAIAGSETPARATGADRRLCSLLSGRGARGVGRSRRHGGAVVRGASQFAAHRQELAVGSPRAQSCGAARRGGPAARALRRVAATRRRHHAGRLLPGGQRSAARRRVLPAGLLSLSKRRRRIARRRRAAHPERRDGQQLSAARGGATAASWRPPDGVVGIRAGPKGVPGGSCVDHRVRARPGPGAHRSGGLPGREDCACLAVPSRAGGCRFGSRGGAPVLPRRMCAPA